MKAIVSYIVAAWSIRVRYTLIATASV